MPRDVGGRSMYMASPEYMATYARHLVQAGAKVVGGCCGTTPEHIRAMCEGVRPLQPAASAQPSRTRVARVAAPPVLRDVTHRACRRAAPCRSRERSQLGAKIAAGEFVTSVEIVPPRGVDATRMLDRRRARSRSPASTP